MAVAASDLAEEDESQDSFDKRTVVMKQRDDAAPSSGARLNDTQEFDDFIENQAEPEKSVSFRVSSSLSNTKRILIVDDEPYNLIAMKIVLEQAEQQLLKKIIKEEVLNKAKGKITDIIDQASNGLDAFENF